MEDGVVAEDRKVSLSDVAERAGVSIAAASMALLGGRGKTIKVGAATREKVQAAARDLRYVPNSAARNLACRRSGFIGYLLSDTVMDGFNNSYFNRFLAGAEEACRRHGYGLYAARATLSDIRQVVFPERLRQQSVDGLIAIGTIPDEVFAEFERYRLPTIFLNRNNEIDNKYACFCVDSLDGFAKAAAHAYALGHRRIWYCRPNSPELLAGRSQIVKTLKLKHPGLDILFTDFLTGAYDEEGYARWLAAEWLSLPKPRKPTFLLGDAKILALTLVELSNAGVDCPRDVSAVVFPDLELNRYHNPPLTCVDFDFEGVASDAVELLLRHIEKGEQVPLEASRSDYPARLVERQSTMAVARFDKRRSP